LALALAVLLAARWGADAAQALRSGRAALPVVVQVDGPPFGADLGAWRISPRGNREPLARLPTRLYWSSGYEWFADLELSVPRARLGELRSITVAVGERRSVWTAAQVESDWSHGDASADAVLLRPPAALRAETSRAARFAALRNWPGDFAVAADALLTAHAFRFALAAFVVVLLRRWQRVSPEQRSRLERAALLVTAVAIAVYTALVLPAVFVSRFTLPLSIEQLEGVQATCTALWAKQGADLYGRPTIASCGNIYTPLYYLVSRAWAALFGLSLPALRAFSWLCLAVSACAAGFVLDALGARRGVGLWLPLYLATFGFYQWLDNANKDALHVCLSLVGFALLVRSLQLAGRRGHGFAALCGVVWAAAFMTKQSHLAIAGLTLLAVLPSAPQRAIVAGAAFATATGLASAAALATWPGYWDWTVVIPRAHGFSLAQLADALLSVAAALSGYFAVAFVWWRRAERRALAHACLAFALGGVVMGLLSAGKPRGGTYALLPGMAALCIPVAAAFVTPLGRAALALPLLLLTLASPLPALVRGSDERAAARLIARLRAEKGDVWVPLEPFANVVAGKRALVPAFCLGEWTEAGRPLPDEVLDPVRRGELALIVTPYNAPRAGGVSLDAEPFKTIAEHYELVEVMPPSDAFAPKDGWINSLRLVWRPRAPEARASALR
jgi:hypothetical protein